MYDAHILTPNNARSVWANGKKYGYQFQITMEIDGKEVDKSQMYVQHRGREYPYFDILKDDFPTDFYWLFGEPLTVVVKNGEGIEQGIHHCRLTLGTRRSYTPTMVSVCEKDITFA